MRQQDDDSSHCTTMHVLKFNVHLYTNSMNIVSNENAKRIKLLRYDNNIYSNYLENNKKCR